MFMEKQALPVRQVEGKQPSNLGHKQKTVPTGLVDSITFRRNIVGILWRGQEGEWDTLSRNTDRVISEKCLKVSWSRRLILEQVVVREILPECTCSLHMN